MSPAEAVIVGVSIGIAFGVPLGLLVLVLTRRR